MPDKTVPKVDPCSKRYPTLDSLVCSECEHDLKAMKRSFDPKGALWYHCPDCGEIFKFYKGQVWRRVREMTLVDALLPAMMEHTDVP